jgi:hypothetical protein
MTEKTADELKLATRDAVQDLIDAAKFVCNASFDELADSVSELRRAGQHCENTIHDLYAALGLLPTFDDDSNVVIFSEAWRERYKKNREAQHAADKPAEKQP